MTVTTALFQHHQIRRYRDELRQKRYFSVVDIVGIASGSSDGRNYRKVLKSRLHKEGSEAVTNCNQLKMVAGDGKLRLTDVADVETVLRIIQSIPSPNAEPLKKWLAKVGYERMQETVDPSLSIDRARGNRRQHGRSEKWIQQRMTGQETRNKLTDYRKDHDIKEGDEFALLTNIIHKERTGMSVKEHKQMKKLTSQNLRDHMSEAELIFTALAELATRQIAESEQATGLEQNKTVSKKGGEVAKVARKNLEDKTGTSVITNQNYLAP